MNIKYVLVIKPMKYNQYEFFKGSNSLFRYIINCYKPLYIFKTVHYLFFNPVFSHTQKTKNIKQNHLITLYLLDKNRLYFKHT